MLCMANGVNLLKKGESNMNIKLNAANIVHHGVECVAFVAIGTVVSSSFSAACAAYGAGKIAYIGTRILLDRTVPELSTGIKRSIGWAASLLAGGSILHPIQAVGAKH